MLIDSNYVTYDSWARLVLSLKLYKAISSPSQLITATILGDEPAVREYLEMCPNEVYQNEHQPSMINDKKKSE